MATRTENPKVFISYCQQNKEFADRVLKFSNKLRSEGIDTILDQYIQSPDEGWTRWMVNSISEADFVIMICTEEYNNRIMCKTEPGIGRGVKWEGKMIFQNLYNDDSLNNKFIPVIFDYDDAQYVPMPLQDATIYNVNVDEEYEALYWRLRGINPKQKPNLGGLKPLMPKERKSLFLWRNISLFDDSMIFTFGMEPTRWDNSGEMLTGLIYATLFVWQDGEWVAVWDLPKTVETDIWGGDPDYSKQYAIEPLLVHQQDIALVVARLGVQLNHPHSSIVALTVERSDNVVLKFSGFGIVTSMKKQKNTVEVLLESPSKGYQVHMFTLREGKYYHEQLPVSQYRPEGSIIEARFIIAHGFQDKIVASENDILDAKVGQSIVFVPENKETAERFDNGDVIIYTDAWNGPPLTQCEANHLHEIFYTFNKPDIVSFLLVPRSAERSSDMGTTAKPTFKVIVKQ